LKAYKDFLQANTNVNAANTCDLSVSNYFRAVMTASAQFTFINAPSSGTAQQFSLLIMQDGTGRVDQFLQQRLQQILVTCGPSSLMMVVQHIGVH